MLKGLWLELDYYQNLKVKCSKDGAILLMLIERERIVEFLVERNRNIIKEYRRNVILDEPSNKGSNLVIVKSPSTLIVVNQ